MKLAKILAVALGFGLVVALAGSFIPPAATGTGSAPVTVVNTPLPVSVNNFPGTLTGASVPVTGNVGITGTPSVSVANTRLSVLGPQQTAANLVSLTRQGCATVGCLLQLKPDGSIGDTFTVPTGSALVITDVECVDEATGQIPAGDAILFQLKVGNNTAYESVQVASAAGTFGTNDHLTTGLTVTSTPTWSVTDLNGGTVPNNFILVILRGFLIPNP